jgi:hypothetical protein
LNRFARILRASRWMRIQFCFRATGCGEMVRQGTSNAGKGK